MTWFLKFAKKDNFLSLLVSGLKFIFHWRAQLFILSKLNYLDQNLQQLANGLHISIIEIIKDISYYHLIEIKFGMLLLETCIWLANTRRESNFYCVLMVFIENTFGLFPLKDNDDITITNVSQRILDEYDYKPNEIWVE